MFDDPGYIVLLAPLALGGLLSPIAFGLVALPFLVFELGRFANTDLRFFSFSTFDLFPKEVRSTAVLGAVETAFLDPPLPLLYYELILYFRLPNKGLTSLAGYSGYSCCSASVALTLLKKSNDSGASTV